MTILLLFSIPALLLVLLLWLRRGSALDRAARELREARTQPGKRLRLASPDRQVEDLLAQINGLLEDREQETRALHEQEESLRRQIANVSHDLRTPLTSILGYLQLLESEQLTPQQRRHYLEIVSDRARVLQDLITAFYDLSRIEGGEYPLDLQPVDLRRALEPLLAGFSTACWRTGSRRPERCMSRRRASAGRSPTSPTTCAPPSPPFWAISSCWNRSSSPPSNGGIIWRSCPTGPGYSRT